jgi:NADH-quinone oxidoreductase subunit J
VAGVLADRDGRRRGGVAMRRRRPPTPGPDGQRRRRVTNAETIGRVLYTDYVYYFQAAGLVLLVAMIGAIVLTLKHRRGVRAR